MLIFWVSVNIFWASFLLHIHVKKVNKVIFLLKGLCHNNYQCICSIFVCSLSWHDYSPLETNPWKWKLMLLYPKLIRKSKNNWRKNSLPREVIKKVSIAADTQDTSRNYVEWPCKTQGITLTDWCTVVMLLPLTQLK